MAKGKIKLSAVVLTRNEQENISECLENLSSTDELLVIDDGSTDKTVESALKHGAKIYKRKLNNDFSAQRNFGLKKASGVWALFIDADERVSDELREEILGAISQANPKVNGFYLRRTDIFLGKQLRYGEVGTIRLLRLARKAAGKWERKVHEKWVVKGSIETLKNPLFHFPHSSLKEFVSDINRYSSTHAEANLMEGKRASAVKIAIFPLGHFINNLIFRRGFLDGKHGFIVALLMSFHSFLGWVKQWELQKD